MSQVFDIGWTGASDMPFSRAELYDAAAYGVNSLALQWLLDNFEVLARPRQRIGTPLRRGDILLRRGEGGLAHACVVVDPEFRSGLEVSLQGGTVEFGGPGNFVFVAERGARPHDEHERFARRVTDEAGRVLARQIVLRPREGDGFGDAERIDPMSIMVGMTLAQQMVPQRPLVIQTPVAAPTPPANEWMAPNFEHALDADTDTFAEFNSPEHFQLGSSMQGMIDNWAKNGLVSGGCFVVDTDSSGNVKPFAQWQFFVPDRSNPNQPYGDHRLPEDAHWHWITPNAHTDERGALWTPDSLRAALREGRALTLSVGDIVMMSGDLIGEFRDYTDAASPGWRGTPVNIMVGLAATEPFAWGMFRAAQFARTGVARRLDVQMLARATSDPAGMRTDIRSSDPTWTVSRDIVDFLRRAAGTRGYHQLLLLSRILRKKVLTIATVERICPWISGADYAALIGHAATSSTGFTVNTPLHEDMFQMIVTNGHYAQLALHNERHFNPNNWTAFETAHRDALGMVDRQCAARATTNEHGPIPANAIALVAYGMHFQTDAFAAGHMRTPRNELGPNGSMFAGVMHDFENQFGLIVTNGLGAKWRAYGDSNLNGPGSREQNDMLRNQSSTFGTPHIDARFTANRDHVIDAVLAAMKQLHYQAYGHFNDAGLDPRYHEVLRISQGVPMQLLWDVTLPGATPGPHSGTRDSWAAMDIPAKIAYLRNHRPVPIAWSTRWQTGAANHPPMAESSGGRLVLDSTHSYAIDQHLVDDHVLYDISLSGAGPGFRKDISLNFLLTYLATPAARTWAGATEVWLPTAVLASWGDRRGRPEAVLREILGINHIGGTP